MRTTVSLGAVVEVLRRSGLLLEARAPGDLAVSGVAHDSRRVREGDLFTAWKGGSADGHDYLSDAKRAGARAAIVERFVSAVELPQIRTSDGRRAAAVAAHEVAGRPTERLAILAVTGTNGKTTVAAILRHLLSRSRSAAAVGTLGVIGRHGEVVPETAGLTTPGPGELARTLASLADEGVEAVVLEASSHALDQGRLDGLGVDVACFTNLSGDHLDYHVTLDRYRDAKAHLLALLREEGGGAVVNGDDPAWLGLPETPGRLLVVRCAAAEASGPPARTRLPDLLVEEIQMDLAGSRFRVRWGEEEARGSIPLLGRFNVENAAVALGGALLAGVPFADAVSGLADAPSPPGRLEVAVREPVRVVLDFAHTPDALRRVLETLRAVHPGRLIVVFGAGGERDRTKRPEMGRAAVEGADLAIVTSDNPRGEDAERIIDDVVAGMAGAPHERIPDRRAAIARALETARSGDLVLLAGKGHETYQEVAGERRPFDERVVLRELLGHGGSETS